MNIVKLAREDREFRIFLIRRLARDTKKSFNTFWDEKYEGGKKMVPNPNPKGRSKQVTAYTAMKHDSFREKVQKEYQKWKEESESPKESDTSYLSLDLRRSRDEIMKEIASSKYKDFFEGKDPISFCLDLCGLSSMKDQSLRVEIRPRGRSVYLSVTSENLEMERTLYFSGSSPDYISNDLFKVRDKGGGTGTKVFSSQIRKARQAGFTSIETYGARGSSYIGYQVWPLMGYNTTNPERFQYIVSYIRDGKDWIKKMQDAKLPLSIQSLYSLPGGIDWWKENGESLDLAFDLGKESESLKILNAYLERKKMDRIAAKKPVEKKPKKMPKGWSDAPEIDEKIMKDIWENRRKK